MSADTLVRERWQNSVGGSPGMHNVSVTVDAAFVAAGWREGRVVLFDHDGHELWNQTPGGEIWSVCLHPDGDYVLAGSGEEDRCVWKLDGGTGSTLARWPVGSYVNDISVTPDGQLVAVACSDHKIYLFDSAGETAWSYEARDRVRAVDLTPDGSTIVACSWDQHLYCFRDRNLLWEKNLGASLEDTCVTPDGERIFAVLPYRGELAAFDALGTQLWTHKESSSPGACATTGQGTYVALGTMGSSAVLLLDGDGNDLWQHSVDGGVSDVAMTPDGRFLVGTGRYSTMFALDNLLPPDPGGGLRVNQGRFQGAFASVRILAIGDEADG
jgi:WD40 repeat protein